MCIDLNKIPSLCFLRNFINRFSPPCSCKLYAGGLAVYWIPKYERFAVCDYRHWHFDEVLNCCFRFPSSMLEVLVIEMNECSYKLVGQ